ncbi:neuronal acetylcholine receptor subunit alpha-7-like [Clytia hemisphaerica]|uniref:neuronal acetylcholine receptor subunit alpha-7-like n=1 Tax=Clytia hemisphaerica TaxID=252671 RepID=UPI0034D70321
MRLRSYSEHSEWTIENAYLKRNVLYYGCCPEPYPDVTAEFTLKRKPLFYVLNLLLPMIFIGVLTLLAFFLPAESGERISFAVTLMLALTVFMLIVADMIPANSEIVPMLGIFFTCVMIEMVLMVFAMCYTLNLHFKEPNAENRIGKWTRAIVYNRLAIYLGVRKRDEEFANANGWSTARKYANGNGPYEEDGFEDVAANKNVVRFTGLNHNDKSDFEKESTSTKLMKKSRQSS